MSAILTPTISAFKLWNLHLKGSVSRDTFYELLKTGEIPSRRDMRRMRIAKDGAAMIPPGYVIARHDAEKFIRDVEAGKYCEKLGHIKY